VDAVDLIHIPEVMVVLVVEVQHTLEIHMVMEPLVKEMTEGVLQTDYHNMVDLVVVVLEQ
jgi:hypothetical protein